MKRGNAIKGGAAILIAVIIVLVERAQRHVRPEHLPLPLAPDHVNCRCAMMGTSDAEQLEAFREIVEGLDLRGI